MKIYKFKHISGDFNYEGGVKTSRNLVTERNRMYYCTSNDLNAIADYLNRIN
jgi:hypothetical protein